jgi:hypothetical protein
MVQAQAQREITMADPTLRSIARSLDIHIKDDHLVHSETNRKLDDLAVKIAPIDNMRKMLYRGLGLVLAGVVVSFSVQTIQNWILHQQAAQTALAAVNAAKNEPTPTETVILKKLDALHPSQ